MTTNLKESTSPLTIPMDSMAAKQGSGTPLASSSCLVSQFSSDMLMNGINADSKAIEHALTLILKDPFFVAGPLSAAFLTYVVRTTLKGEGDRLKAYTIAVEALEKPNIFDPQNDTSVRVMAFRIRAALDRYNAKPNVASVVITMKIGSYKPIFTLKLPEVSNQ